jgi:hypothetical protein
MLILFQQPIHIEYYYSTLFLSFNFNFNRMNMLLIDINEENLFQILQDQMVQR